MTDYDRTHLSQDRTPLIDAIRKYVDEGPAFFRVPGHRFERGVDAAVLDLLGEKAYRADLTEAEGLDDLHHPSGAILEAEKLAADLYGSDYCWFLVNGTTSGNEAMILSVVGPGEKILIDRNAHRSVFQGLILSGAVPVWIMPRAYPGWDLTGSVAPEAVETALDKDPDIKAVFITSPTYYGVASDLRRIAEICHAYGLPLLVDEAHGSHLNFFSADTGAPEEAVAAGADLVSQSTHKTCGSMTESSMLHLQGNLVSRERTDACLKLVTSTSPNYLLMSSLDGARHLMAQHGEELMTKALRLARMAEEGIAGIPGYRVLGYSSSENTANHTTADTPELYTEYAEIDGTSGDIQKEKSKCPGEVKRTSGKSEKTSGNRKTDRELPQSVYGKDPLRLVFSACDAGISGNRLHELLYQEGGVSCELSDSRHVVCVITWGNTEEDIHRLIDTCKIVRARYGSETTGRNFSETEARYGFETSDNYSSGSDGRRETETAEGVKSGRNFLLRPMTPMRMTPRQAFYSRKEKVPLEKAVGRIAAESITPYPPGVPIVCPGEELTEQTVRDALAYQDGSVGGNKANILVTSVS